MNDDARFYGAVKSILLHDWDPLGVGNSPALENEYDDLVPILIDRVSENWDVKFIERVLFELARDYVCIPDFPLERGREPAIKLAELFEAHFR